MKSVIKAPILNLTIKNKAAFDRIQRIMINQPNVGDNECNAYYNCFMV